MVRMLLLMLAAVPGAAPFLLGSELLGALLLVLGLNAWNLAFLGYFVLIADNAPLLGHLGLTFGLLTSVGSVAWTAVITSPTVLPSIDAAKAASRSVPLPPAATASATP